jgi:hypothetical protein
VGEGQEGRERNMDPPVASGGEGVTVSGRVILIIDGRTGLIYYLLIKNGLGSSFTKLQFDRVCFNNLRRSTRRTYYLLTKTKNYVVKNPKGDMSI